METNPLLLLDYYKTTHHEQYPAGLTKLVSYLTPRMSRIEGQDKLIMFGLQAFIQTYLIDYFNRNFFWQEKEDVVSEYKRVLDNTLGKGTYDIGKIEALYDLGYLPLEIKAVPEGTRVPIKVPMIEISNTHPDFAWLVNTIESLMSAELWHPMVSANVGYWYREIVNRAYAISVENDRPMRCRALGDFSFRGQESLQSATKSSAAFCLSFLNTATVPAILWLENNYLCNSNHEDVAYGAISTEHSVMCSNFAVDGDEISFVRRLLTEIYPNNSFSMVSDSYDYWHLVDEILPQLKTEIMQHNGTLLVRGDSGDPVDIVVNTVFHLWDIFGGTVNSKGYKVLDPHVKALYGDSITLYRCSEIFKRLIDAGFACNNVSLGVGSFSMQCIETVDANGSRLNPFTRDTYGIAVKATYGEIGGKGFEIFKNPKTDNGHFKKSQRGICRVYHDMDWSTTYEDGLTPDSVNGENMLETVFRDGRFTKVQSLHEIRDRLHAETGGF